MQCIDFFVQCIIIQLKGVDFYGNHEYQHPDGFRPESTGMNLSTAFNVFVRQSLRDGGIPFEIKMDQPNKETMAAMLEAERIAKDPNVKHYSDVEEALRELKR